PGRPRAAEVSRVAGKVPVARSARRGAGRRRGGRGGGARLRNSDPRAAGAPRAYIIRPRRLQSIARESVARYGGQLPSDQETLLPFKGIGSYTAGAVRRLSFCEGGAA